MVACFNPRPRMEGDIQPRCGLVDDAVSIHAPAWRATGEFEEGFYKTYVSIHAPAWRATEKMQAKLLSEAVSIHAPAWRATVSFVC